jgi:hypothetical protein
MYVPIRNFPLTESRIETLITAKTLDEARRMGIIETILDFFRGGIKKAAIEDIFTQIVQSDGTARGNATLQQLGRFQALQDMIRPEHLDKLQIHVQCDPHREQWSYGFAVAGIVVAQAKGLPYGNGHELIAFQDAAMLARIQCALAKPHSPVTLTLTDEINGNDELRGLFAHSNALASSIGTPYSPQGYAALHDLGRFQALQGMIRPADLDQLQIKVQCDSLRNQWSYEFTVAGSVVAEAKDLPCGNGHELIAFQDAAMLARIQCVLAKQQSPLTNEFAGRDGLREAFTRFNAMSLSIDAPHADIAQKFSNMAATMTALHAQIKDCPECVFEISINGRDSYTLRVNDEAVHRGHFPPPAADREKQYASVVAAAVSADLAYVMQKNGAQINDLDQFIDTNVSCMIDGAEASDLLKSKLDDPSYSAANYSGVLDSSDSAKFIARFGEKELVFSNRRPSVGELRGERLKNLLASTEYTSLRDIASHDHMGPGDGVLFAAAKFAKMNMDLLVSDMSKEEIDVLHESIRDIDVCKTTLGELWQLPAPLAVPPARQVNDAPFAHPRVSAYA